MRVGMLKMRAQSIVTTRFVSSLEVTAISMSVSAAPASVSTCGLVALAHDAAQVESRLQGSDALGVLVNDGDVVGFGDQTLGDRAADAACAHNKDFS